MTDVTGQNHPGLFLFVGLAIFAVVGISCVRSADEATSGPDFLAGLVGTSVSITPVDLDADEARNDAINDAIRVATVGCPGSSGSMSGPPTRILMAVTTLAMAGPFIHPGASFDDFPQVGPGGGGGGQVSVWVVAIEGRSTTRIGTPAATDDAPGERSGTRAFLFVLEPWNPTITGCVVREAPMDTSFWSMASGGFDFDVLLDSE
ncbi:MAG: hypothetical protein O3C10_00075 [Chloroflexi bacterium]|nr:hypothetical protein [Chloroflexota bacterium]